MFCFGFLSLSLFVAKIVLLFRIASSHRALLEGRRGLKVRRVGLNAKVYYYFIDFFSQNNVHPDLCLFSFVRDCSPGQTSFLLTFLEMSDGELSLSFFVDNLIAKIQS